MRIGLTKLKEVAYEMDELLDEYEAQQHKGLRDWIRLLKKGKISDYKYLPTKGGSRSLSSHSRRLAP